MKSNCEISRGFMKRSVPALVAAAVAYFGAVPVASAALTNFSNTLAGTVSGGTVQVTLNYNLRDNYINSSALTLAGSDKFPDKMLVSCLSGMQNNGVLCESSGYTNAFQAWGFDSSAALSANPAGAFGIASYVPFAAYQDEYFAHVILNLTSGPKVGTYTFDTPINKITLTNNIEFGFTQWHDRVSFETAAGLINIDNVYYPMSGGGVQSVAPLGNVYLEDALLTLPSFPTTGDGTAAFDFSVDGTRYFASISQIGNLTAIPEPSALALMTLGLGAIAFVRRRNKG